MSILVASGVARRYGDHVAVRDFSCTVESGEVAVLVGPNGCGKTTSVEMAVGLRARDAGRVEISGRVGVQLQNATLHARVRVQEHLEYLAALYGDDTRAIAERLGLRDCLRRTFGTLSGGQQRRALVAAAFAGQPRLVVLDEPTSGIDLESRQDIWASLRGMLRERDAGVLVTTHDLAEAERHADRILVMRDGAVIAAGSPSALVARSGLRAVVTVRDPDGGLEARSLPPQAVVLARSSHELTLGSLSDTTLEVHGMGRRTVVIERRPAFEDAYLLLARSGR